MTADWAVGCWIDGGLHTVREANQGLLTIAGRLGFSHGDDLTDDDSLEYVAERALAFINDYLGDDYEVLWDAGDLICVRRDDSLL